MYILFFCIYIFKIFSKIKLSSSRHLLIIDNFEQVKIDKSNIKIMVNCSYKKTPHLFREGLLLDYNSEILF